MAKKKIDALEETAFSIVKRGKTFRMVKIKFDPTTKESEIESITNIPGNDQDYDVALYEAKKFLVEGVMWKLIRK